VDVFFLGAHMPHWLGEDSPLPAHVPLCVSRVRLAARATLPRARGPWLLDSGGFSALSKPPADHAYASWPIGPHQYVKEVRRFRDEIGHMVAAAPMDWMCESPVIRSTGMSVLEHLRRTVVSLLELRWLSADLPIIPVLQGDATRGPGDHLRCAEWFEEAGIDLAAEPLVGVGSCCRLQSTRQIVDLFAALDAAFGGKVRLHAFGLKTLGLSRVAPGLWSADSQAWSKDGYHAGPCRHGLGHKTEANCPTWAMQWYERVLAAAGRTTPQQWARTVEVCARGVEQPTLFPEPPGPNAPTYGQQLARAVRAFLPDTGDPELTPLARMLDTFREAMRSPQGRQTFVTLTLHDETRAQLTPGPDPTAGDVPGAAA
jgi:hypothetical protein